MTTDGYEWLERFDTKYLQKCLPVRNILLFYFVPFGFEKYRKGLIYKVLGVHVFERYLPTGGIKIRRWTGKSMQSYTLRSTTLTSAKVFRYKSCFFELLHMPFFIALMWRSLWWYFEQGNIHLAIELLVVNAIFNIYPMMHQRYTRVRIERLVNYKKHLLST